MALKDLADEVLHARFCKMGTEHKLQARRLMGMLGELVRRGIPQRRGYPDVFEFGQREAGLSKSQIDLALRLHRTFAELPALRQLFEEALAFPNRLRAVAAIACPEWDQRLAELVQKLPKAELEVWVRDWKSQQTAAAGSALALAPVAGTTATCPVPSNVAVGQTGRPGTGDQQVPRPGGRPSAPSLVGSGGLLASDTTAVSGAAGVLQTPTVLTEGVVRAQVDIRITAVVHERLLHEQSRLATERGRPVSWSELMLHLLDGTDRSRSRYIPVVATTEEGDPVALRTCAGDVPIERADLESLTPVCKPIRLEEAGPQGPAAPRSRARPAAVDRVVQARSGGICEIGGCRRPGGITHHVRFWSVNPSHNPKDLLNLCPQHANLADRGIILESQDPRVLAAQRQFEELHKRAATRLRTLPPEK